MLTMFPAYFRFLSLARMKVYEGVCTERHCPEEDLRINLSLRTLYSLLP